jgi:anti-sigma-K factor RskA
MIDEVSRKRMSRRRMSRWRENCPIRRETLPETSLDKEMQRRIMAINAVTAYCGVEEGTSYRSRRGGRPVGAVVTSHEAKMSAQAEPDTVLQQAKLSVRTDQRPLICFLCVGNPSLPWRDQVKRYATVGSLSRHFTFGDMSRS